MTTPSRESDGSGSTGPEPGSQELARAIQALDLATSMRERLQVGTADYDRARAVEDLLDQRVIDLVRRQNRRFQ